MKLSKVQRATLREMFGGLCAYCACDLPEKGWHADHVEPVYREWWKAHRPKTTASWDEENQCIVKVDTDRKITMGRPDRDCIENMMPACRACNIDKGPYDLEHWRTSIEFRIEVCRRNDSAFRHAERFGRVIVITTPVVFHFEKVRAKQTAHQIED